MKVEATFGEGRRELLLDGHDVAPACSEAAAYIWPDRVEVRLTVPPELLTILAPEAHVILKGLTHEVLRRADMLSQAIRDGRPLSEIHRLAGKYEEARRQGAS